MSFPKVALLVLLMQSLPSAASDSASDALILQEIADSLRVPVKLNITRKVDGRVTYLSLFYQGQRGAVPPALGGLTSNGEAIATHSASSRQDYASALVGPPSTFEPAGC